MLHEKNIFYITYFMYFFIKTNFSYCSTGDAEKLVKDFYNWYIIEYINKKDPLEEDDIYKYINHCVVSNIRIFYKRAYFDANYFTKSQDIWKGWLDVLVVHKETKIDDITSIVPVSFRWSEDTKNKLIVFVQNENGTLRITKIVDTYLFEE